MALTLAVNNSVQDAYSSDDLDDQLSACIRYFEEAEESTWESRQLCERDRDYYDGRQWTEKEEKILRKRGQPVLTVNKIQPKIEFLRGFERRVRSDPKAFPRTPNEEKLAEAATDALRFVGDQNDFNEIRSDVYESMLIEGTGGIDVIIEPTKSDPTKIAFKRIPWDRLFYDPHSTRKDCSDVKYKGIVIWMDRTDAINDYPDARAVIENTMATVSISGTYEDKPKDLIWCDSSRKRVRIIQIHYKWKSEWMIATFTKGGFLIDPQVSPYLDKDGNSCSSLHLRSAYIDRENNRYGAIRTMISPQEELNKRRSKALHLFSVRQTYGTKESVLDTQGAKNELAKPDGHVELAPGAVFGTNFGVLPTGDMAQGQMMLLANVTQELQAVGPNSALAGKDVQDQSGRAIQAQQQGGAVEIEPGLDDLRLLTRDIYEAAWMRIKQFWTDEKWVRVTDDERNIKWVGLNKKVTLEEKLKTLPPEQAQQYMQQMQLQPGDPRLQEVVEVENDVSGLDVDIIIEEGPDTTTIQSEQFDTLAKMPGIPPAIMIKASSLRNKDQILDEIEKGQGLPPEVQKQMQEKDQAMQEMQQKLAQLTQQLQQAGMDQQQAQGEMQLRQAELQIKDRELTLKESEVQATYNLRSRELDQKDGELQIKAMSEINKNRPQEIEGNPDLDAAEQLAGIHKTQAETEQTEVETELMIGSAINEAMQPQDNEEVARE